MTRVGDLVDPSAAEAGEADQRHHRLDPTRDLAPVGDRLGAVGEAEGDVVEDAEMGKEREALKDEADAAAVGLDRE